MTAKGSIAFIALAAAWGGNYALITIAVDGGVPPPAVAFLRVAIGAALLALTLPPRTWSAVRGHWPAVTLFALVDIAIPFLLIAIAERDASSSLAAIVIAASPLMLAVLAFWLDRRERPTLRRSAGLLVGFAGVTVLVGIDGAGHPWATAGLLAAAAGCAIGPLILKRHLADVDARAVMCAALGIAAAALAPAAALSSPTSVPSTDALAAMAALAAVCTAAAYALYGFLITEVGAARAIVVTYLTPLVAVAIALPLLGEQPGAGLLGGMVLILAGSWLATRERRPADSGGRAVGIGESPIRQGPGRLPVEPS